ncbi:MAG: hypothetical protein IR160_09845 [Salinibacterium sp.]|nr:hypothetical protein [Salinibacterium sp.]MBF0672873.1 hypothetical protein [Salinibacterium sp.]
MAIGGQRDRFSWEVPGGMPVLSRGRHRRPRQGACFMEFASYLAGETWSDHPQCTHPFLAFLARGVNDFTSDQGRQRLATHIPSVVGLTGDSPIIEPLVALRAAVTPIGVAAESAQRSLAAGVLACEAALDELACPKPDAAVELLAEAHSSAPLAMAWAKDFAASIPPSRRPVSFSRRGRAIVSTAVLAAADALVDDPDALLHAMLVGAIADTRGLLTKAPQPTEATQAVPVRDGVTTSIR